MISNVNTAPWGSSLGRRLHALKSCLLGLLLAATATAQDNLATWVDELRKKADDADIGLIGKIADVRSRAAVEGLASAYEVMTTILMKREIARALPGFEGVADAEQPAFDKLANIATNATEPEVREAALKGLGKSKRLGKHYLKKIVDSEAPDTLREPALREHVASAAPEDAAWYKHVWNLKAEQRKYADGTVQGAELNAIRELAFAGVANQLTEDELVEALRREQDPKIRRAALATMHKRKLGKTAEMAQWLMERVDFPGIDRAEAARILVDSIGAKAIPVFLNLAKKRDVTPEDLRQEMARLIGEIDDETQNKNIVKLIGKGKPHERTFVMRATMHIKDPKILPAIRKELLDKELEVRRTAAAVLGQRRDAESVPTLRTMLEKSKHPADPRLAIEAISEIEQRSAKWLAELAGMTGHAEPDVRNAALEQLALSGDLKYSPQLLTALEHADWTTRLLAISMLPNLRDAATVPKLIDRMEKEQGRLRKMIADSLWKLTGQPFEENFTSWRSWWKEKGATFKVIAPDELAKAAHVREQRRLSERTQAGSKFFGIRIESHRVIFILDTSGSMLESLHGKAYGKWGASRIDIAKAELSQCIKNLDEGALFNILIFSTGVDRWLKAGIGESTEPTRQSALTWIERLGAAGATNLYDSLKLAFDDKDVDTIMLLSDGEPTSGEVIDPHRIREDVAFWNKHRRVKIHTVAIGGNLEVLEWLSADSGGTHVRMR
jgi:HEAT repeat protein